MRVFRWPTSAVEVKRLAALVLVVCVFFLPLHFHSVTGSPKVAKECACLQGSRTQAHLAQAPVLLTPPIEFQPIAFAADEAYESLSIPVVFARAPPVLAVPS